MLQKHKDLQLQGEWRGQEKEEQSGCGLTWSDVALTVPCPLPRSGRAARIPVRHCELSNPATLKDAKSSHTYFQCIYVNLRKGFFSLVSGLVDCTETRKSEQSHLPQMACGNKSTSTSTALLTEAQIILEMHMQTS